MEFWRLLRRSVGRFADASAMAFSGGLDSASVVCAWPDLSQQGVDAYTYVADCSGQRGEQTGIAAFLKSHSSVCWHPVDVSSARSGANPRPGLSPIQDDPDAGAAALRPARRCLLEYAAASGVGCVVDGEGGDEIFEVAIDWRDLVDARHFISALAFLVFDRRFRRLALHRRIVPRLPPSGIKDWLFSVTQPGHLEPPWVTEAFVRSDAYRTAHSAFEERIAQPAFASRLRDIMTGGAFVGGRAADRLMARSLGLDVASPLADVAIVELAATLTPQQRMSVNREKAFLRRAGRGVLPETLLRADKDNSLYWAMLRYLLRDEHALGTTRQRLENVNVLRGWIDQRELERQHADVSGISNREANSLYRLQCGLDWMAAVEQRYGVS